MRLKVKQQERNKHSEIVTTVGWNSSNELYSCSDDMKICVWDINGDSQPGDLSIDTPVSSLSWQPGARGMQELMAQACTDGTIRLVNRSGRVEKQVPEAHKGAVICIQWSHDGSTIATGGEDGLVKVWAKTGMLRSTLSTHDRAIFSLAWGPASDAIVFTYHKHLYLKHIQAGQKQSNWKAHDGCVLSVHWSPSNNLIISGGEDCKYKIWDTFGRNLFTSAPYEYVITSVAWSPNGEFFTVGAFDMLRLCDKTGWTYSLVKPRTGSILSLAWSWDGTSLAGAGGNGAVVFGNLVDKKCSWGNIEIQLNEDNTIRVVDVIHEMSEELEFRERVINLALGYNHLVVTTASQCSIYSTQNWQAPSRFDIRESASMIVLAAKVFALVDLTNGIQLYTYEGRQVSNPKFSGLRVEFLSPGFLSIASDMLAVVDTSNTKVIRLFDAMSGKPMANNMEHSLDVIEVGLNQVEHMAERKLCLLDSNRDLFLASVHRGDMIKLSSMVDTFKWSEGSDMLAAIADDKLLIWYYPNVVYVDRDLLQLSRSNREVGTEVGKMPVIESFSGALLTVRRVDGRVTTLSVSPYPALLYECSDRGEWERGIRLCRFVKDPTLWACLAAMSLHSRELNTAEIALAAIDEVDKVQFINHIKLVPSEAGRNAELALFCKRPLEAEQILLQARLYYRAIKMNIRIFKWERALDIALANKKHIDTVIAYRKKYLQSVGKHEHLDKFKQFKDLEIDWVAIKTKIKQEREDEAMNGRPYDG